MKVRIISKTLDLDSEFYFGQELTVTNGFSKEPIEIIEKCSTFNCYTMKVNDNIFQKMISDLRIIIKAYNIDSLQYSELSVSDFFTIWHFVYSNRRYSNDNRNVKFVDGKRILEQDNNFEYYPCDTNDNTLLTALKKAVNIIYNN